MKITFKNFIDTVQKNLVSVYNIAYISNVIHSMLPNASVKFDINIDAPAQCQQSLLKDDECIITFNPLSIFNMFFSSCKNWATEFVINNINSAIEIFENTDDKDADIIDSDLLNEINERLSCINSWDSYRQLYIYLASHEVFHKKSTFAGPEAKEILIKFGEDFPNIPSELALYISNVVEDSTIQRINYPLCSYVIRTSFDLYQPKFQGVDKVQLYMSELPETIRDKLYFFIVYFYSQYSKSSRMDLIAFSKQFNMSDEIINEFNKCVSINDSKDRMIETFNVLTPMIYDWFLEPAKQTKQKQNQSNQSVLDCESISEPQDDNEEDFSEGNPDSNKPEGDEQDSNCASNENKSKEDSNEQDSKDSNEESEKESEDAQQPEVNENDQAGSARSSDNISEESLPELSDDELKDIIQQLAKDLIEALSVFKDNDVEDRMNDIEEEECNINLQPSDNFNIKDVSMFALDASDKFCDTLKLQTFYDSCVSTFEDLLNSGTKTFYHLDSGELDVDRMTEPYLYGDVDIFYNTERYINQLSMRICFVLDSSGSMFNDRFYNCASVIAALKTAFSNLNVLSRLITFSDEAYILSDYENMFPDLKSLYNICAISDLPGLNCGTDLYRGLDIVLEDSQLLSFGDSKLLIVLTDGDTCGEGICVKQLEKISNEGVIILGLYLGNYASDGFKRLFSNYNSIVIEPSKIQTDLARLIYEFIIENFMLIK